MDESYPPYVSLIYKDYDSFKIAFASSYYHQLLLFELITGELIMCEEVGCESYTPCVHGEIIDLKTELSNEQVLFYISIMDISEGEHSSGWYVDYTPYTFLYSYQNQFEFVTFYENVAHIFQRNRIAYGVSQYSQGEFEGPSTTDYISRLYTINQTVFPPTIDITQELWWKSIQLVTSDEEINTELGFVYSYLNENTRKFVCTNSENDLLWESEYPLNNIHFSANYEQDGQQYIVIFDENKVILYNHSTGELVHSEIMESSFFKIRKSSNGEIYYFSSGINGYQVYLLNFVDFFVTNDDAIIEAPIVFLHNYPNPFNPSTTISFSIPEKADINLSIYNIKGQKVNTLAHREFERGMHKVVWNGKDKNNKAVSSGVYFYKLDVNGRTEAVKKCLLLK
jgi:hypothetical protein